MTRIIVTDRNGKIVFHSVEPRLMTEPQVKAELKRWRVNPEHNIHIIYG